MNVQILGLGTAAPQSLRQDDAAEQINRISFERTDNQKRLLKTLFRSAGIQRRGTVLLESPTDIPLSFYREAQSENDCGPSTRERMDRYSLEAGKLGETAARKACADAAVPFERITHLITVSCTGFYSPGADIQLIKTLGLSADVGRLNVGFMGCHGALNGLRAAQALAASDPKATILLCAIELCSLHFQYGWDRDRMVANSLFADGAAAVVIGQSSMEGAPPPYWNVRSTGSHLFADSEDAMTWRIGDHGFEMTLSPRVPDLIGGNLAAWLARWLESQNLRLDEIGSFAIHPGGPRILNAVQEALKLSDETMAPSRAILAQHGNMSSPTVIFILEQLRAANAKKPCVMLGFGPGLVAEAAVLG